MKISVTFHGKNYEQVLESGLDPARTHFSCEPAREHHWCLIRLCIALSEIFECLCGPVLEKKTHIVTQSYIVSHTVRSSCFKTMLLLLSPKCLQMNNEKNIWVKMQTKFSASSQQKMRVAGRVWVEKYCGPGWPTGWFLSFCVGRPVNINDSWIGCTLLFQKFLNPVPTCLLTEPASAQPQHDAYLLHRCSR